MRQITDPNVLQEYIARHHLQDLFSFDLTDACTLTRYETDEIIARDGYVYNSLSFLLEGECIAYVITGAGKPHCENHYRGFNVMGLVGALWQESSINTIRAITPCMMMDIPLSVYREQLLGDERFLRFAVKTLAEHIRKSAFHFEHLEVRLSNFILEMEKDGVFDYNLTICADLLEASYRHLLRILRNFCDEGILSKTKKGSYLIVDRARLENLRVGISDR